MSVVIVDWLGRGGIAQCTEAWAMCYLDASVDATVVTRPDRELGGGTVSVVAAEHRRHPLGAHRAVVERAVEVIKRTRPELVIVQNYVIPPLESPVHDAARQVGAQLVLVIHDHRLHSRRAGTSWGLVQLLRKATTVITHSRFVGDAVGRMTGREVSVVPLPVQVGLLGSAELPVPFETVEGSLVAIHFGTLRRSYKGSSIAVQLARRPPPGWEVALVGLGAPVAEGLLSVDRFLRPGELVSAVRTSAVSLLPYRWATQSGAVVLAQALGSVVIATRVGGLPEQIQDRQTGILIDPAAGIETWWRSLEELRDESERRRISAAAFAKVWDDHRQFCRAAVDLVTKVP